MARLAEVFTAKNITFGTQVGGWVPCCAHCGWRPAGGLRARRQRPAARDVAAHRGGGSRASLERLPPWPRRACCAPQSKRTIQVETAQGVSKGREWHLLPTGILHRVRRAPHRSCHRRHGRRPISAAAAAHALAHAADTAPAQFKVKQTPAGATPVRTQASLDAVAAVAAAADAATEVAGAAMAAASGGANGGGSGGEDVPQRLRSATLLRQPGTGMLKAAELMRASQAASEGVWREGRGCRGCWRCACCYMRVCAAPASLTDYLPACPAPQAAVARCGPTRSARRPSRLSTGSL